MAVADEARCFGNSWIHGCCHLSKVFLGFLQAEAIEREEDQEWITLQLSNLWSGQLVLRNCWPGACAWKCRFHQMTSMNTLMFRECLVLSSKNWSVLLLLAARYPTHHKESCLAVRHLQLPWHSECHLDSLDVPSVWVHRLQPNTRHSESDKSDSWLGPWDLLSSLSLDVFASAVTRSWESLFFKAASDLFFLLFQVSIASSISWRPTVPLQRVHSVWCPRVFLVTCILTSQFLGTLVTSQAMHAEDLWRKSFGLSFGRLFQSVWHFCCLGSNAASWQPDWWNGWNRWNGQLPSTAALNTRFHLVPRLVKVMPRESKQINY